jgi:hypothetical protein
MNANEFKQYVHEKLHAFQEVAAVVVVTSGDYE